MTMPGFTAEASLGKAHESFRVAQNSPVSAGGGQVFLQLGFGGFGPTLPTCRWEKQWVVCGSPLPGYPPPMCLDWVYICTFPGSSRNVLF